MSKRNLGILVAMVGSAVGTWWMISRQQRVRPASSTRERGVVIFDNTPVPADTDAII